MAIGGSPGAPRAAKEASKGSAGSYVFVAEVARSYLGTLYLARDSDQPDKKSRLVRHVTPLVAASTRAAVLESARWASALDGALPVEIIESRNAVDLATPLVDAEPLRSLLRTAALKHAATDPKVLLGLAGDLLRQLDGIHQRAARDKSAYGFGAVHPDSILVGSDGRVLLVDLGIGAVMSAREPWRADPQRIGYFAPEQLEARPVADARTDVFAVGIILWEALANRRLFPGNDAKAARERLQKASILRLDATRPSNAPGLPTDIADVVARALDRSRDARFATAGEMAEAIATLGPASAEEIGKWVVGLADAAIAKRRVLLDRASLAPPTPRPSLLPGRASIPPGRLSVPPRRASIPPGRLSVPPERASIAPGRLSVPPERASTPPSRPAAPAAPAVPAASAAPFAVKARTSGPPPKPRKAPPRPPASELPVPPASPQPVETAPESSPVSSRAAILPEMPPVVAATGAVAAEDTPAEAKAEPPPAEVAPAETATTTPLAAAGATPTAPPVAETPAPPAPATLDGVSAPPAAPPQSAPEAATPAATDAADDVPDSDADALEVTDDDLDAAARGSRPHNSSPRNSPPPPSKRLPPLPASSIPPAPTRTRADDSVLGSTVAEFASPVQPSAVTSLTAPPKPRPKLHLIATAAAFVVGIGGTVALRHSAPKPAPAAVEARAAVGAPASVGAAQSAQARPVDVQGMLVTPSAEQPRPPSVPTGPEPSVAAAAPGSASSNPPSPPASATPEVATSATQSPAAPRNTDGTSAPSGTTSQVTANIASTNKTAGDSSGKGTSGAHRAPLPATPAPAQKGQNSGFKPGGI